MKMSRDRKANCQGHVELFNLANDPYEKQNLVAQKPEKVKTLRARYDRIAAQAGSPKVKAKMADFKVPKVWVSNDAIEDA